MKYKSYQHIEKYGTKETEGILNGKIYLSYKIDGTNGVAYLGEDGQPHFGSRKRELSLHEDNAGFMNTNCNHLGLVTYLSKHPNRYVYGEWLVPHTLKTYNQSSWYKFYVFDVLEINDDSARYVPYDEYVEELIQLGIDFIPVISVLENPTLDDVTALLDKTGEFLCDSGLGEGIVIKNYNYHNCYGRQTWAKLLTEDFKKRKEHKSITNKQNAENHPVESQIISKFLTPEHIQKEYHKMIEIYGEFTPKNIFELLNRVFEEFIKDNMILILKKIKSPTINFRVLKQLCDTMVKEVLKF